MLIRITHQCAMGCTHCIADALPDNGKHMGVYTFIKALALAKALNDPLIMLSGGEPSEHSKLLTFVRLAKCHSRISQHPFTVLVLSNGRVTEDKALLKLLLKECDSIQVTNDPRYYPTEYKKFKHKKISYEHRVQTMMPLGRALASGHPTNRRAPLCFNLRSLTKTFRDLSAALTILRTKGKFSAPSIDYDGTIRMGESPFCAKIGTVDSSILQLTRAMCGTRCQVCGLVQNLTNEEKEAIGE